MTERDVKVVQEAIIQEIRRLLTNADPAVGLQAIGLSEQGTITLATTDRHVFKVTVKTAAKSRGAGLNYLAPVNSFPCANHKK